MQNAASAVAGLALVMTAVAAGALLDPAGGEAGSADAGAVATGIHFRLLPDLSRSALNSLPAFHSGHFPEFASERPTS